jgi:hypothetical protein
MDSVVGVALLWLVSVLLATFVGYLRDRSGDALTLGVLLGPVGLALTLLVLGRHRHRQEGPTVLKISDAPRRQQTAVQAEIPLRRAA